MSAARAACAFLRENVLRTRRDGRGYLLDRAPLLNPKANPKNPDRHPTAMQAAACAVDIPPVTWSTVKVTTQDRTVVAMVALICETRSSGLIWSAPFCGWRWSGCPSF